MAVFICMASGNPTPLIAWIDSDGVDLSTLGDPRIQISDGTLTIGDIVASDGGMYVCSASNSVGVGTSSVQLDVLGRLVSIP